MGACLIEESTKTSEVKGLRFRLLLRSSRFFRNFKKEVGKVSIF